MALFSDSEARLGWAVFNGASWNTGWVSTKVPDLNAVPFGISFQQ